VKDCRKKLADSRQQDQDHRPPGPHKPGAWLSWKRERVVKVPEFESPKVPAQVGQLMFLGLLDTGLVRSFISYDQFMQLQ
jgi:hypothetical protein